MSKVREGDEAIVMRSISPQYLTGQADHKAVVNEENIQPIITGHPTII